MGELERVYRVLGRAGEERAMGGLHRESGVVILVIVLLYTKMISFYEDEDLVESGFEIRAFFLII